MRKRLRGCCKEGEVVREEVTISGEGKE